MFRASIKLFLLLSLWTLQSFATKVSIPASPGCELFVKTYVEYVQKIKGVLKNKSTISDLGDWSLNGQFQGFLLTDQVPRTDQVEFVLEFQKSAQEKKQSLRIRKISPWKMNSKYRVVDIDVQKHLGAKPKEEGSYQVSVFVDQKLLCTQKKRIFNDGE